MQVVATRRGYFGSLIEPGQTFEVPQGTKGSWFEPISKDEHSNPAPGPKAGKASTTTENVDKITRATK